jgi:hypothetical protein
MYTAPYTVYSGSITTTSGYSSPVDMLAVYDKHYLEVAVTTTSTGDVHAAVEGSLDGVNWYTLLGDTDVGTGPTADLLGASGAARYIRVAAWTGTGTTSVTITGTSGQAE